VLVGTEETEGCIGRGPGQPMLWDFAGELGALPAAFAVRALAPGDRVIARGVLRHDPPADGRYREGAGTYALTPIDEEGGARCVRLVAAAAPRPPRLAVAVALEGLLISGNLPIQTTDLHMDRCWAALSVARGAVLELPLARGALSASLPGVHRRFYRRPMVNPLLLPPGVDPPAAWKTWAAQSPLMAWLDAFEHGQSPPDPGAEAVRALRSGTV